jgi:transcriptional regulator with XRE-family HTH domain
MSITDQYIGERVRAARERIGMPQATVAAGMALAGFSSWNKSTLSKVEAGDRALKLSEAATLRTFIGCTLDQLVAD